MKCHGSSFKKNSETNYTVPRHGILNKCCHSHPETWPVVICPFRWTQKGFGSNFILIWLRVKGQCLPTHHPCKLGHLHQFPGTSHSRGAVICPFRWTQKGFGSNFILIWLRVKGQCLPTHHPCKLGHLHRFPGTSHSRGAVSGRSRGRPAVFLPGLKQATLPWMYCLKESVIFKRGRVAAWVIN